ncbi:MAG: ABC transporter permease [Bacteroidales bacterium]|nr:ABC transporter permease [Bacteroidales bacterium]MDY0196623.1 ABC transporter permease [Tenuifilaceae bacterium]
MSTYTNREGSPWKIAFRRFFSNRLSLASSIFIGVITLIAVLGYIITPDDTPWANNQHLEIATQKPGFKGTFFLIPKNVDNANQGVFGKLFWGKQTSYREVPILAYRLEGWDIILTEYTEPEDSVSIVTRYTVAQILFPNQLPNNITYQNEMLLVPSVESTTTYTAVEIESLIKKNHIKTQRFWLGTDRFGRDMLSRLIIGARVSLSVGFIAVAISLVIGIVLGATAGYFRGWFDDLVMWLVNVVWSIPTLLMVIALTMVMGKGFWQIFVAVGLTMWVEVARVVRGQVMALREKEFIEAAKVMGFGSGRIIFQHIIPNVLGPVAIISAGNFATAILLEAGLSFLGIGVQPPVPSWGTMIKDHYGYIIMDKAYLAILPGIAIMLLVLAFTIIGNGLRDAMDTKSMD